MAPSIESIRKIAENQRAERGPGVDRKSTGEAILEISLVLRLTQGLSHRI